MTIDSELIVYDFDSTLTTTDTIKITILCLLVFSPWRIGTILRLYLRCKNENASSEKVKHAIIGSLISGQSEKSVNGYMKIYTTIVRLLINRTLWQMMMAQKNDGAKIVVATASPFFAIHAFMNKYGIDVVGTQYQVVNGKFTGEVEEPIPFHVGKLNAVREYMKKHAITSIKSAYSDSLSDMPVLSAARNGFIVSKKCKVEKVNK